MPGFEAGHAGLGQHTRSWASKALPMDGHSEGRVAGLGLRAGWPLGWAFWDHGGLTPMQAPPAWLLLYCALGLRLRGRRPPPQNPSGGPQALPWNHRPPPSLPSTGTLPATPPSPPRSPQGYSRSPHLARLLCTGIQRACVYVCACVCGYVMQEWCESQAHTQCPDPTGDGGAGSPGSLFLTRQPSGDSEDEAHFGSCFLQETSPVPEWHLCLLPESPVLRQPFGEPVPVRKITDRAAQCWGVQLMKMSP